MVRRVRPARQPAQRPVPDPPAARPDRQRLQPPARPEGPRSASSPTSGTAPRATWSPTARSAPARSCSARTASSPTSPSSPAGSRSARRTGCSSASAVPPASSRQLKKRQKVTLAKRFEGGRPTAAISGDRPLLVNGVAHRHQQHHRPPAYGGRHRRRRPQAPTSSSSTAARPTSRGYTMVELADFMTALGVGERASTSTAAGRRRCTPATAPARWAIVNEPSDGGERKVANGFGLIYGGELPPVVPAPADPTPTPTPTPTPPPTAARRPAADRAHDAGALTGPAAQAFGAGEDHDVGHRRQALDAALGQLGDDLEARLAGVDRHAARGVAAHGHRRGVRRRVGRQRRPRRRSRRRALGAKAGSNWPTKSVTAWSVSSTKASVEADPPTSVACTIVACVTPAEPMTSIVCGRARAGALGSDSVAVGVSLGRPPTGTACCGSSGVRVGRGVAAAVAAARGRGRPRGRGVASEGGGPGADARAAR